MEDEQLLAAILHGSDEISYDGKTKVEGYSHRYSVNATMMKEKLGGTGPFKMIINETEKAEYQIANKYRGILRTSKPLKTLLEPESNNQLP